MLSYNYKKKNDIRKNLYKYLFRIDKNSKKSIEENEVRDEETEISRLFGSEQMHIHRCLKCGQEATKHSIMLLCNLVYPELTHPCKPLFMLYVCWIYTSIIIIQNE